VSIIQAILLGIVQGLTEFLPISSSGHLEIVPWAFDWHSFHDDQTLQKTFDVALHLGTLVAVVAYYWRELGRIVAGFFRSIVRRRAETFEERLSWLLLLSTIPAGIVGVAFEDFIVEKLGQPYQIAVMLVLFGIVMWVVDQRAPKDRSIEEVRWKSALAIGFAQAIALVPGVSRSSVTMVAGMTLRLDRESAARYSFLMSVPVIAGAALVSLAGAVGDGLPEGAAAPFAAGMASAAVSGFAAIWFLLAYLRRHDFRPFAYYRFALAAAIVVLIVSGVRPATGI
jgi:undecaprenyl-diphosphatase